MEHSTLHTWLLTSSGVKGNALASFQSYLTLRKQYICIESSKSRSLDRGVPHGSLLEPLLYLVYTSPIGKIIKRHGIQYHLCADDSQINISFRTDASLELLMAQSKVELRVTGIYTWMVHNGLKLNRDKSELKTLSLHPSSVLSLN